jgi:glutamate-ammonia-ligase adenylyltransferase
LSRPTSSATWPLRLASLRSTGEDDDEALLNLLRRAHHAETFRTLARDVEGRITVEQVADDLSAGRQRAAHHRPMVLEPPQEPPRDTPQFGIIGYGKLGGKELGYGSDLDIVFVFDDDDERAPQKSTPPSCAS